VAWLYCVDLGHFPETGAQLEENVESINQYKAQDDPSNEIHDTNSDNDNNHSDEDVRQDSPGPVVLEAFSTHKPAEFRSLLWKNRDSSRLDVHSIHIQQDW
jgi:hypothetical protein